MENFCVRARGGIGESPGRAQVFPACFGNVRGACVAFRGPVVKLPKPRADRPATSGDSPEPSGKLSASPAESRHIFRLTSVRVMLG
jgi:hypothetical protein